MHMTPDEKQNLRTEIESRMADTEASVETLREQTKPVPPSCSLGRLTRMDAIQQKQMAEANLKQAESNLSKLKRALERLDEDDFGICASCGGEIPAGRIMAVPEARVCVPCASGPRR
jgi:DnaK suppressor protein